MDMGKVKITGYTKFGITGIIFLIVFKFLLVPIFDSQKKNMEMVSVLKKRINSKNSLLENKDKIESAAVLLKKRGVLIKSKFQIGFKDPQALQLSLQKKMDLLAKEANISISNIKWKTPSEGNIVRAPIGVRCEGHPENIYRFIYSLENSEEFITIDNIIMRKYKRKQVFAADFDLSAWGLASDRMKK